MARVGIINVVTTTNKTIIIWRVKLWLMVDVAMLRLMRRVDIMRWIRLMYWVRFRRNMGLFMRWIGLMGWISLMRRVRLMRRIRFMHRIRLMRRVRLVRRIRFMHWIRLMGRIRLVHWVVHLRSNEAVEGILVVIIEAWPAVNLFQDFVWVRKVVIDKQSSRFGFPEIGIRSDIRIVNLDVSLLFHTVNHHEEQIINGDLVNVLVLGVVVVLVIIVVVVAILFVTSTPWVLATAGTIAIPAKSSAMKNGAKPVVIAWVSKVLMKSINLVGMSVYE